MAKIEITKELLERHSDAEIIDHLYSVLSGVMRNYNTALKTTSPEILWGSLGDIAMVTEVLSAMKKRNDDKLAQIENS